MFESQLEYWRDKIATAASTDSAMSLVDRTLRLLADIDGRLTQLDYWQPRSVRFIDLASVFGTALSTVSNAVGSPLDELAYDWVAETVGNLQRGLAQLPTEDRDALMLVPSWGEEADTLIGTARHRLASRAYETEQVRLLEEAKTAVDQAVSAAEKAQESAGVTGNASLARHFSKYAGGERTAANTFRILSILAVAGALVAAVAFGPVESGNWAQLTYRVATVAAAGTLAAYFARQAGQHRRMYNWAKSLEVQLKSFPAFMEAVPESDRSDVYQAFARRVLSAPPEKGVEAADDSVGAAQLLDLVTALAKRG